MTEGDGAAVRIDVCGVVIDAELSQNGKKLLVHKGDKLYAEAEEKKAEHDHLGYLSKLYEAFGNEVKAYGEIAKMNEDMLKAVIAYMALMLPFCFFLQKLLFNFKKLEHELEWHQQVRHLRDKFQLCQ